MALMYFTQAAAAADLQALEEQVDLAAAAQVIQAVEQAEANTLEVAAELEEMLYLVQMDQEGQGSSY